MATPYGGIFAMGGVTATACANAAVVKPEPDFSLNNHGLTHSCRTSEVTWWNSLTFWRDLEYLKVLWKIYSSVGRLWLSQNRILVVESLREVKNSMIRFNAKFLPPTYQRRHHLLKSKLDYVIHFKKANICHYWSLKLSVQTNLAIRCLCIRFNHQNAQFYSSFTKKFTRVPF